MEKTAEILEFFDGDNVFRRTRFLTGEYKGKILWTKLGGGGELEGVGNLDKSLESDYLAECVLEAVKSEQAQARLRR
jgi:hypothetical protein